MQSMLNSLLLVGLGVAGVTQQAWCAEPASPAMVRIVNLVGPDARIDAVLEPAAGKDPEIALKTVPYPSLGEYVAIESGRDYQLDVEGTAPGVGGFGSQQHLTPRPGHHYTLLLWGTVNVQLIDQQALFPFPNERLANVVLLDATRNDSETELSTLRQFVFGDDGADSTQFAFTLQSSSFAGILRGYGARANVLEAFQTTAGKLPLSIRGPAGAVLASGDLTLKAQETHFVVVIGEDQAPEVVFITNDATTRLEK